MSEEAKPVPVYGVVAVYIDPEGRVIAHAADFDRQGYGGFSLQRAQEIRVKNRLARKIVHAYCSEVVTKAIDQYDCERIVDGLKRKGGKITLIPIGWEKKES